ncbi:hypothetical protein ES705_43389 [subsurface metagenome]
MSTPSELDEIEAIVLSEYLSLFNALFVATSPQGERLVVLSHQRTATLYPIRSVSELRKLALILS